MTAPPTKPRVVHVITGLGDGGAEGVLYRLCKFDHSFDHVVISLMDGGRYAEPLRDLGVPVHGLGLARGRVSIRALRQLLALLRRYRPAVVQSWLYHADLIAGIAARALRVPKVVWGIRHGELVPGMTKPGTLRIARLSARLSWYVPHAIVSCSHTATRIHVAEGYDPRKIRTINNGYDLRHFTPDPSARQAFRAELGMGDHELLLGTVARYHAQKDHPNLLRALAILARRHRFQCVLVGTGMTSDNTEIIAMLRDLGLVDRVHLLGQRNDVPAIMNGIDVHVVSSGSEGFPNVVAEAMACGAPNVVTDVGDSAYIVGETGWVAPPFNSARLAEAIEQSFEARRDSASWALRCEAARERVVTCFSVEEMVGAFGRCWSE